MPIKDIEYRVNKIIDYTLRIKELALTALHEYDVIKAELRGNTESCVSLDAIKDCLTEIRDKIENNREDILKCHEALERV